MPAQVPSDDEGVGRGSGGGGGPPAPVVPSSPSFGAFSAPSMTPQSLPLFGRKKRIFARLPSSALRTAFSQNPQMPQQGTGLAAILSQLMQGRMGSMQGGGMF